MDLSEQLQKLFPDESVHLTPRAEQVLRVAMESARRDGRAEATANDVAAALLERNVGVVANVLGRLGVNVPELRQSLPAAPGGDPADELMALTEQERRILGHTHIGNEHLLLGLLRHHSNVLCELLKQRSVMLQSVREAILRELDPSSEG